MSDSQNENTADRAWFTKWREEHVVKWKKHVVKWKKHVVKCVIAISSRWKMHLFIYACICLCIRIITGKIWFFCYLPKGVAIYIVFTIYLTILLIFRIWLCRELNSFNKKILDRLNWLFGLYGFVFIVTVILGVIGAESKDSNNTSIVDVFYSVSLGLPVYLGIWYFRNRDTDTQMGQSELFRAEELCLSKVAEKEKKKFGFLWLVRFQRGDIFKDEIARIIKDLDFRDISLEGEELNNIRFPGIKLKDANLSEAKLMGSELMGAKLMDADLSKAELMGAKLMDVDLTDADLTGAYLSDADLTDAQLHKAKLIDAKLNKAKLNNAYLSNAKLIEAKLIEAKLIDADLTDADLTDANLTGADLSKADLRGAIFSKNTILNGAVLRSVKIYGTKNNNHLITVVGVEPSKIDGFSEIDWQRPLSE